MILLPLRSRSPQKHQKSSGFWTPVGRPKRCSPSCLYAFLALAGFGSVLPQFVPQNLPYTDFGGVTVNLPSNSAFWTLGEHRNWFVSAQLALDPQSIQNSHSVRFDHERTLIATESWQSDGCMPRSGDPHGRNPKTCSSLILPQEESNRRSAA